MSQYITDFRAKHPEYNDLDDNTLVNAIHGKFYSDIPINAFNAKIGFDPYAKPTISSSPVLPSSSERFEKTLRHEGGIVDDPDDPGGYTAFGLSTLRFGDKVRNIKSQKDALPLYQKEWQDKGYDRINDEYTAQHMFDIEWLSGQGRKNVIDRAANDAGLDPENLTDSINKATPETLRDFNSKLVDRRKQYFDKVVELKPQTKKFKPGWNKRAESWREYQQIETPSITEPTSEQPIEQPVIEKAPEEKSMLELVGDKLQNMIAGAEERGVQLAGQYLGGIETLGRAFADFSKTIRPEYKSDEMQELQRSFDIRGEKIIEGLETKSEEFKGYKSGYVENVNWEDVKSAFKEGGPFSGSAYAKVLEFGVEQGIRSLPDMAAAVLTLPAYIFTRSEEIGQERAKNKGKDDAELSDVLEAAPAALGFAILERVGVKGIVNAGKSTAEEIGTEALKAGLKESAKRITKEGGKAALKEGATEFVQEGIIEYVGEKFGTDAKMDFAEAFERGVAGAVAGGVFGGATGTATATAREVTKKPVTEQITEPTPETITELVQPEVQTPEPQVDETTVVEPEKSTEVEEEAAIEVIPALGMKKPATKEAVEQVKKEEAVQEEPVQEEIERPVVTPETEGQFEVIAQKPTEKKSPVRSMLESGIDKPMPKHEATYGSKGMPARPTNDIIKVGDKDVKLKPEDNPTRREGIQVQVERIIGPRIYQGKVKGKTALGTYNEQNSEVRIRDFADVEVLAHEMAHYLDYHYKMKNRFRKSYENSPESIKEIKDLSYTSKPELVKDEGFAEFVRLWLTQYEKAIKKAPIYTKRFEVTLAKDKSLNRKMKLLQADMHRWFNQGNLAKNFAVTSGNKFTRKEQRYRLLNRRPAELWRQHYVDHIHAAKVITRDVKGQLDIAEQDPYKQLQLLNGHENIFEMSVKYGAPQIDNTGKIVFKGPSLKSIWNRSLKTSARRLREQEIYFASQRALETTAQERENLFDEGMIKEGQNLGEKYPYFKKAFKDYQEYNKNLHNFFVESGLISKESSDKMLERNKNYVPFNREIDSVLGSGGTSAKFMKLSGGTQNIKHIYDNIMKQDSKRIQEALKAKALRDLYTSILDSKSQEGSKWFTEISSSSKPVIAMMDQMKAKTINMIEELGIEVDTDMKQSVDDYFKNNPDELIFWSYGNKPKTSETMVDSFIDEKTGKRRWVEINKDNVLLPDMLDALGGFQLPKGIAGKALALAMKVKNLQTLAITSMMQFAGPNIVRDQQQAFFLSGGKFLPVIDTFKGLSEYLKSFTNDNTLFDEMKAQGGPGAGRTRTFLENEWGFNNNKKYKSKKPFYHPTQMASDLLNIYINIMDSAEMSTRIGFYSRLISQGFSPREAAFKAREISTDFAKHGSYAPFVLLQRTVPFFGAYVQSVDRDLRGMFDRNGEIKFSNLLKNPEGEKEYSAIKAKMVSIGMMYVATHIALSLLGSDEEKYKELTPDQKTRFFHFFIGDKHYTMPKPHGFVSLLGSFAEGITDLIQGQEKETVKKDILFAIAYHLGADAVPGILTPVSDVMLNETFTGAPIVSKYAQKREPRYQYTDRTPQLYVKIGDALNKSPDQVRHMIRGYTGYIEEIIAENTEEYMWDYEAWGERPERKTYTDMMTKQFKPREVPYRTKYTSGYYDLKKRYEVAKANLQFAKSIIYKDTRTLKRVITDKEQQKMTALKDLFKKVDKFLSDVPDVVSSITYNKDLSGKEKKKQIEEIYKQKNKLLKETYFNITKALQQIEQMQEKK